MTPDPTAQAWLEILCRFISGVESAVVLLGTEAQGYEPAGQWPPAHAPSLPLCEFASSLLPQQRAAISVRQNPQGYQVHSPIMVSGRCFGAACVQLSAVAPSELERAKQLLAWGNEWFVWLARERKSQREQDGRLLGFVKVMAIALKSNTTDQSAKTVVDALAEHTACSRVSLALKPQQLLRVIACSDVAAPSMLGRSEALILNAMAEAEAQAATVTLPAAAEGMIRTAHERLLQGHAVAGVCSIPMIHEAQVVGVITFEGGGGEALDVRFLEQVTLLLGAIFNLQLQATSRPSLLSRVKQLQGLKRFAALSTVATVIALGVLRG